MRALVIVALAVLFLIWLVGSHPSPPDDPQLAAMVGTVPEQSDGVRIGNAEYAISQQMRDPESAQFRDVSVHAVAGGEKVVCGEVNSKNGYGGYAGFQRFVATGRSSFLESQMESKSFALVWKSLCADSVTWRPAYP